jgi:4-amino-4-deoxy-L-arabinose transferase-like glycosyltransferase
MTPSAPARRREGLWLGLLLVVALALRLFRLGQADLWWDEALAIWAVRKGLVGATVWTAGDVHPPLYFWALWAWVRLFGESPFAMRSLSVVIGTLTVWATYGLGRQVGGRQVGLLAAALTAVAPFAVWWSQEMRMYALAGLLCTLSWRQMLRWFDSERHAQRPDLCALALGALASLGALYTVFLSAAALVAQAALLLLYWLATGPRRRLGMVLRWAAAQVAVLALLSPWLIFSWERMPTWSVAQPVSPLFVARLFATLVVTGQSVDIDRALPVTAAVLLVLAIAVLLRLRRRREPPAESRPADGWQVAAMGLAVAVPTLFVYVSTLPRGLFYSPHVEARYFYPFAPAFWVLLAWSAAIVGQRYRWLGWALAAGLLAVSLAYLPGHYRGRLLRDDLQSMVRTIISQARPGDVVLLDSGSRYPVFLYDYERVSPGAARPAFDVVTRADARLRASEVLGWMDAHLDAYDRVWLAEVEVTLTDKGRLVRAALDERRQQTASWAFGHNTLLLYTADGQPPRPENASYALEYPTEVALGGGRLQGYDLPVRRHAAGGVALLALQWSAAPGEDVWLHLQTADGHTLLRRQLPVGEGATRLHLPVPLAQGLPRSRLQLSLEDAAGARQALGELQVVGRRGPAVSAVEPQGSSIGGLTLQAYSLHAPRNASAGDAVVVDLLWRADTTPPRDYTVFVHVLGAAFNPATNGPVWGQSDAQPAAGLWPTDVWAAGDTYLDRHIIRLPVDAPAGEYQLEVGLYDGQTGERAPVLGVDGAALGDRLVLPGLTIR